MISKGTKGKHKARTSYEMDATLQPIAFFKSTA